jgi:hypothetical protein|tara:strand:- start:9739 stop:9933 length:195 start_codon:yes stop_codon:yes gene_type:complete
MVADSTMPVKFYPFDYKSFAIESLRIEHDSIMRVFVDPILGSVHCILLVDGNKVLIWQRRESEV